MAGIDRMTVLEVVREVLRDEHADVIRDVGMSAAVPMLSQNRPSVSDTH
jgi:hypothetical protein